MAKGLNAALNVQKRRDPKLVNTWSAGLTLHDTYVAREAGLSDQQVVAIVAESGGIDPAFGLYVETHAVTGARTSQIAKLKVVDLQHADSATHRLMMPSSVKGRGRRQVRHVPVPITPALARKLKAAAAGRGPNEPLLLRADGEPWRPRSADHRLLFMEAAKRAGAPAATMIWLRHSSIIRALIAGTPDPGCRGQSRHFDGDVGAHLFTLHFRPCRSGGAAWSVIIPEAAPENVVRLGGRT